MQQGQRVGKLQGLKMSLVSHVRHGSPRLVSWEKASNRRIVYSQTRNQPLHSSKSALDSLDYTVRPTPHGVPSGPWTTGAGSNESARFRRSGGSERC